MKIVSGFMRGAVSKIVRLILRKKTGYDVDIQFNDIKITVNEGKSHVHLDLDAELEKEELMKILKKIGIG